MSASGEREMLTTGRAARICAVKPDTVLKWIKKGRLEAVRTAGGHYRIQPQDVEPFARGKRLGDITTLPPPECNPQPMRCWEYLSPSGQEREECKKCVVYRVRAAWCFQVAGLSRDIGHAKHFCKTSCQDCAYYRRVQGLATHVLVITADQALVHRLQGEAVKSLAMQFAQNAYEASAVVYSFRPDFVVLDQETHATEAGELVNCLASDPRIPGLKVVLAVRRGRAARKLAGPHSNLVVGVLEKPFGARGVATVIDSLPVEVLSSA